MASLKTLGIVAACSSKHKESSERMKGDVVEVHCCPLSLHMHTALKFELKSHTHRCHSLLPFCLYNCRRVKRLLLHTHTHTQADIMMFMRAVINSVTLKP